MAYKINVGDLIPAFKIKDSLGENISNDDLTGSPLVIYFYPKDGTPGCTQEACSFRDNMERLEAMDVLVIGVSPDSAASHEKFSTEHDLNFTLLPDEKLELCRTFDVIRENNKLERTTFVIDGEGIIRWIERPVNVVGHVDRIMQALQTINA